MWLLFIIICCMERFSQLIYLILGVTIPFYYFSHKYVQNCSPQINPNDQDWLSCINRTEKYFVLNQILLLNKIVLDRICKKCVKCSLVLCLGKYPFFLYFFIAYCVLCFICEKWLLNASGQLLKSPSNLYGSIHRNWVRF